MSLLKNILENFGMVVMLWVAIPLAFLEASFLPQMVLLRNIARR